MADKALLAGINDYRWVSDLRGCVNDVRDVERLLIDQAHFRQENVRTLRDGEVTRERVVDGFYWLLDGAEKGDRLVFHFSGHGSYTTDLDDDEPDGVDEILCLHDMDWDDKNTYLLDDDLRNMTARVPPGVFLTVILDSCHSGTATRMVMAPRAAPRTIKTSQAPLVDLSVSLARMGGTREAAAPAVERLLAPPSLDDARQSVLARFLDPPSKVRDTLARKRVRSSIRGAMREIPEREMNHVLLSGSKSSQTSADAYIDGEYHGAFSYYLCRAVREEGIGVDYGTLIKRVRRQLADEQFSQVPQLEPGSTRGPFLKWNPRDQVPADDESKPGPGPADDSTGGDLKREIVETLREIRAALREVRGGGGRGIARSGGGRALVYVHGICLHKPGYSKDWWNALRPHLNPDVARDLERNRHEVLWSQWVTPQPGARSLDRAEEEEETLLAQTLKETLNDRARREVLAPAVRGVPGDRGLTPTSHEERALLGIPGLDCIDDFVKYLRRPEIRAAVQNEFLRVVEPLLDQGRSVEVISHSWGTVVAYEALRQLDRRTFDGCVRNLFTVGSALSIGPVRARLEPANIACPRHVRSWMNLDAEGDVVGGDLRGCGFPTTREFLDLPPVGCKKFLGQVAPACAHGSYFVAANVRVNRDIFAQFID